MHKLRYWMVKMRLENTHTHKIKSEREPLKIRLKQLYRFMAICQWWDISQDERKRWRRRKNQHLVGYTYGRPLLILNTHKIIAWQKHTHTNVSMFWDEDQHFIAVFHVHDFFYSYSRINTKPSDESILLLHLFCILIAE